MSSNWCTPLARDVGVIIVAGGAGIRVGGDVPKQYRPLAGTPMVVRTVRRFLGHPRLMQLMLVLPAAAVSSPPDWLAALLHEARAAGVRLGVVAGGATRSDSVRHGLDELPAEVTVVLVHDAARPFVERAVIDAVLAVADAGEAAIAAVPLGDTLKAADPSDPTRAVRTVPREHLWRAQTPQGFPAAMLRAAHAAHQPADVPATDDAALVERQGHVVRLVTDDSRNFKVTTAADLALAELIAAGEERGA